jgi:hypothetical protein
MKRIGLALAAAVLAAGCSKKEPAGGSAGTAAPPATAISDAAAAEVPADAAAETVTFTIKLPEVGEIRDVTDVQHLTGTVKANGADMPIVEHREEKRTEEVLALDGAVVTKLKVSFDKVIVHDQQGKDSKKPASPLEGKTFVATWDKGAIVVVDDKGKKVPPEVAALVASSVKETVGREAPMRTILVAHQFRTGEPVVLTPDEARLLAQDEKATVGEGTSLTLLERKDDVATLSLDSKIRSTQGAMTTDIAIKGTIKLEVATGRPREMNLAGDIKSTGAAEMTGTMSGTKVFAYRGGKK